ncbi:MAG TPA: alpha-amylase family glycosyl hydrolase [Polyangiaceae bacterium]|jgi:glycosidase
MVSARLAATVALALAAAACAAAPAAHPPPAAPAPAAVAADQWASITLYLALTDRFADGDARNDDLGEPDCFAPSDPDRFHGGDIAGLRQHLPYLRELGVGALWITPLPRQVPLRAGACGYHGYWADESLPDEGAMEPKLGTIADVTALATDLHAAGMKLVLDVVVNHPGRGARITRQAPWLFHDESTCAPLGDPVVFCPLHGLPDYAQEKPEAAQYLTAMSRRWVERTLPDGVRVDTAKHVPPAYFAASFVPAVRAARPGLFLLAEYFDTTDIARVRPTLDAGFDSAFDFPLHEALVTAFARGESVNAVADVVAHARAVLGEGRASHLVSFLDNHDVPRFLAQAAAGTPDAELARRYAMALAVLFTLPEIPQLYQGDELAMAHAGANDRADMPAWSWDPATRVGTHPGFVGDAQATWQRVRSLARLRATEPALSRGTYVELHREDAEGNVLAYVRTTTDAARPVLVVVSNDTRPTTITLRFERVPGWSPDAILRALTPASSPGATVVRGSDRALAVPPLSVGVYGSG